MALEWYVYPLVIVGGFATGVINTVAGSGSLISLPLLISLGLPANIANGTNRVAITLQNAVGTGRFHSARILDHRAVIWLGAPAMAGSVVGASLAVGLDEELMRRVIGALLVGMFFLLLVRPQRWIEGRGDGQPGLSTPAQALLFFGVGVYGGFIQAGVGIFYLAALVLGAGHGLVRANAIKIGINLLQTLVALLVFVWNDQVVWGVGLLLAAGTMLGAWFAASLAVERGGELVYRLLIAIVAVAGLHMLGLTRLVVALLT